MKKLLVLIGLAACGGGEADDTIAKIEGTASVGDTPAKITSCKAVAMRDGQVQYAALEVGLDTGHTVIVDTYAGSKVRKGGETTKLSDCSKVGGHSGGGVAGSKAWSHGDL